jgi:CBS domain-containing protein
MATVKDILLSKGSDVVGTAPTATIRQAVRKMAEANVGCLIVEMDGGAIGIFTERDLLRRVVDCGLDPETTTIAEVMTAPIQPCRPSDDVGVCARKLQQHKFRHLVVLDKLEPVGVISMRDLVPLLSRMRRPSLAGRAN